MNSTLTPRLASSKRWTDLPIDFTAKVQAIFADEFQREASLGEFLVEGRIYPEEVVVRIGYIERGRLKQVNFEASMDLPKPKPSAIEADITGEKTPEETESGTMAKLYASIDALGSLMEEYFDLDEEEEIDIPRSWKPFAFEGQTIYLQQSSVNSRLEEEADRLLGLADQGLVQEAGNGSSEDALAVAEIDNELAAEIQKAIRSGKHKPPEADPQ